VCHGRATELFQKGSRLTYVKELPLTSTFGQNCSSPSPLCYLELDRLLEKGLNGPLGEIIPKTKVETKVKLLTL